MIYIRTRTLLAYDAVRDYVADVIAAVTGNRRGRPTVASIISDLEITADELADVAAECADEIAANDLEIEALTEDNDELSAEAARALRINQRLTELFA